MNRFCFAALLLSLVSVVTFAQEPSQFDRFYADYLSGHLRLKPGTPRGEPGPSAVNVPPDVTLSWQAFGARTYDVLLAPYSSSSSCSPVRVATDVTQTTWPVKLAPNRAYCWKIVARNGYGTITSPTWKFTTADMASQPVDCVTSAWTLTLPAPPWGACQAPGTQTRAETYTRTVVTPASNGGAPCGPLTEVRTASQACTLPTGAIARPTFTAGVATFGQAIPQGLAPEGLAIGNLTTQADVKNRWPDGSIKFAIVSAIVTTAGNYTLTAGPVSSGTPLTPTWPSAAVQYVVATGAQQGTWTATLPPFSGTDSWLSGPIVRESRVLVIPVRQGDGMSHPYWRVRYDVRTYANGATRVDIASHNTLHSAGDTITANIKITLNGAEVFSKDAHRHFYLTRWRRTFWTAGSTESNVTPDFTPFVMAKALPSYESTIDDTPDSIAHPTYAAQFTIGGKGGVLSDGWETAGARPELGPYPDWVARYIVHKGNERKRFMVEHDSLAGSWPVHVSDDNLRPLRTDQPPGDPGYWLDARMPAPWRPLGNFMDPAQTKRTDLAHCPSFGYASYLTTGDRFHLDTMKFLASYSLIKGWPGDPWFPRIDLVSNTHLTKGGSGLTQLVLSGEIRGAAWALRNITDAAAYTPDADADRAYFITIVSHNLKRLDLEAQRNGSRWTTPEPAPWIFMGKGVWPTGDPKVGLAHWQVAFTVWATDHALDQGLWGSDGIAYRNRGTAFLTDLFQHEAEGYPRYMANASVFIGGVFVTPSNQFSLDVKWHSDWKSIKDDVWARDPRDIPFVGYHGMELRLPLLLGEVLNLPGARTAYDYLMGEGDQYTVGMKAYVNSRAGWAIRRGSMGQK